jgi:hypothetical protein
VPPVYCHRTHELCDVGVKMVVLYGPPAVGKLTVAQELSRLTGIKLFHNHLSWNAVTAVFAWRSDPFVRVLTEFRLMVFREAAQANIDLVFTYVYSAAASDLIESFFAAVEAHGGTVCLVRLSAPRAVLEQHVTNESRTRVGKMATVEELHRYLELKPDAGHATVANRSSLDLDTSMLDPTEAAKRIIAHYGL